MARLTGAVLTIVLCTGCPSSGQTATQLSEVQHLKAENFQLRLQIAQLRATLADRENRLASVELSATQVALVEEFRRALRADKDEVFDWATLAFRKPTKEERK